MKIVLNKSDVIEKARAAFLAGELQCQQDGFRPDTGGAVLSTVCQYSGPCAIGVALSEADRDFPDQRDSGRIRSLWCDGFIECSREDMKFFDELQMAHDRFDVAGLARLLGVE